MNATTVLLALALGAGLALAGCQTASERNTPSSATAGTAAASNKQSDCARADSMNPLCRTNSCVAIEGNFCDL